MRISAAGRFLLAAVAVVFSACDSSHVTKPSQNGSVGFVLPRLHMGSALAHVSTTNTGEPAQLHIIIKVDQTGTVLLDKTIPLSDPSVTETESDPNNAASVDIRYPLPASAEGQTLSAQILALDDGGAVIFQIGPVTFTPSADGSAPAVTATTTYVGPNSNVTSVAITPRSLTIPASLSQSVSCVGNPGGATEFPMDFGSDNEAIATVDGSGSVFGVSPGTAHITCRLGFGTHATDVIPVTITTAPIPGISLVSGGNQSGVAGSTLANVVRVKVIGPNRLFAANVPITFTPAAGSGTANPSSSTTASDGTASTSWTLGTALGGQSMVVAVPSLGFTFTVNATATVGTGTLSVTTQNSNGTPIGGVTILVRDGSNTLVGNGVTNTSGSYTQTLAPGSYTVTANGGGFSNASATPTIVAGQIQSVLFSLGVGGSVSGTVIDAVSDAPLSGVLVEIRSGNGVTTGTPLATVTTAASGFYSFSGLSAGVYTIRASRSGYADASGPVTISATQPTAVNIPMSAAGIAGQVKIVVSWVSPIDLDSRLTLNPSGDVVRWNHHSQDPANGDGCQLTVTPFVCLQNDDQGQGTRVETMTMAQFLSGGSYVYEVYNYNSDNNLGLYPSPGDAALSGSRAHVDVYFGTSTTAAFSRDVPTGQTGDVWRVFSLTGTSPSSLTLIDQMLSVHIPSGSIRAGLQADSGAGVKGKNPPKKAP